MSEQETKKKFQLTVMREDSEAENHIFVEAYDLCEAIKIFRRDYPHMKDYALASQKVIMPL